jgi:bifunctional N-acetylglucosamine-1-phosphate-uridyltransferase/glucosamine-1-phosphate-acetyltransferase GlmU-like protein
MIIPAAGLGTRLHASGPKALLTVNGKTMLDHLLDLYSDCVDQFVIVLHPSFEEIVRRCCEHRAGRIRFARQDAPTGMLDALLIPLASVLATDADRVWITWCDQVAIHPNTVRGLKRAADQRLETPLIFPTARRRHPYVHLVRDRGRIVGVLHRREGDAMPEIGENDVGLFSLSRDAYQRDLVAFSREARAAAGTGERNFLPFIPWLASRGGAVQTFPCVDEREAIGINTPGDLREVERYLEERGRDPGVRDSRLL